jgi:hypothetical protein
MGRTQCDYCVFLIRDIAMGTQSGRFVNEKMLGLPPTHGPHPTKSRVGFADERFMVAGGGPAGSGSSRLHGPLRVD